MNTLISRTLIAMERYNEVFYKDVTDEFNKSGLSIKDFLQLWYKKVRETSFTDITGSVIEGSTVKRVRLTTEIEYYKNLIFPHLPLSEKSIFTDIESRLSEKQLQEVSLSQIMKAMNRKKQEKKYEEEMTRVIPPEEIERRKKQVAQRPRLFLSA